MHALRHAHLVQLYGVCLSGSKVREACGCSSSWPVPAGSGPFRVASKLRMCRVLPLEPCLGLLLRTASRQPAIGNCFSSCP